MSKLTLKSKSQIIGDLARTVLARTGLNDLNPGSVLLTILEAVAQEDYAQYYQMLQIVRNYNLNTTTGTDLDNRAFEYGLERESKQKASGKVTIQREAGFVKISNSFYAGFRARISGDTTIFVNNAEDFPASGTLIIGRGTNNEEEVAYATAPTDNVNYWTITLSSALTNDHGLEESVILKQGSDLVIPAGTVVKVPATTTKDEVSFVTTRIATILAGEESVEDVDVSCTVPGIAGNIGVGAINGTEAFSNAPFDGARATNESAFTNGKDRESDPSLRNRIRNHIQALTQSTKAGILNAISGLVDSQTAKRVVSANVTLPDNSGEPVKIYIDDGTGFEPSFTSVGGEVLTDGANGGEEVFQLENFPLVKAQVETLNSEPFDFSTSLTLIVQVGTVTETITFHTSDFAIPEAGTAEEVNAAINDKATLFQARTSQVGKNVVLFAKDDDVEDIRVVGGTANASDKLNFSTREAYTLYLYKNDELLSKNGSTAYLESNDSSPFDLSGEDRVLRLQVDGKTNNIQTIRIKESDFGSAAEAAVVTAEALAEFLNESLVGATASDIGDKLRIYSNTENSASSKIKAIQAGEYLLSEPTAGLWLDLVDNKIIIENNPYTEGTKILYTALSTAIGGLTSGNYYYVVNHTGDAFQLESTVGGGAINLTTIAVGSSHIFRMRDLAEDISLGYTEAVGKTKDYDLNPELGVISLESPLSEGDSLTAGGAETRAFITAENAAPYTITAGHTLTLVLDGGSTQTITFAAHAAATAQAVVDDINTQLVSGKAFVRTLSGVDYVAIRTNSYDADTGVVEITGGTVTGIEFPLSSPATNEEPHTAFVVSGSTGPWEFVIGESLAIVLDNNAATSTYSILMDYAGAVTSGASTTVFAASDFANVFDSDDELNDFYLIFNTGANTITGTVEEVESVVGDSYRYYWASAPANFGDFAIDDHVTFSDMGNAGNDGSFLITGLVTVSATHADVLDKDLSNPSALSPSVGDRYLVGAAAQTSTEDSVLDKDLSTPPGGSSSGDRYIVAADANDTFLTPVDDLLTDSASASTTHGKRYIVAGTGLNDWAGHDWEIAEYNGVGTPGWVFTTPTDLDVVVDNDSGNTYQFTSGTGTWVVNAWGGRAGKVAEYDGSDWTFTTPQNLEVRNVVDESLNYQYSVDTNTWTANAWGAQGNKIAQWGGASWTYTSPATNDVVTVVDEGLDYQYDGTSWDVFRFWVDVTNTSGAEETGATGTGLVGQRRQVSDYVAATGTMTLSSALRATPSASDTFSVIPSTRGNVVDYFGNRKITSLSREATIEVADDNSVVQISSLQDGSDGYVQVTGGSANVLFLFSTTKTRGLLAYAHYEGLIKLAHKTLYGDETDLVAFPGVVAAGIKVQVLPPTVQETRVIIAITLEDGVSLRNVENEVKTQVSSYINSLGVGKSMILSQIINRVMEIEGVYDASIETPTANVNASPNELIRTRASLITITEA